MEKTQLKVTILTGTFTLLFIACIALSQIQPALQAFIDIYSVPTGTVAGVAIGGVIEPTPTNTLYAELQTQQIILDKKNAELEAERRYLEQSKKNKNTLLYILIGILGALVLINFYFDMKRYRSVFKQEQHT